jgi:hypothetical protein
MTAGLIIGLGGSRYAWTPTGWQHLTGPDLGPVLPYIHGAQANPVRWMVEHPSEIQPWTVVQRPKVLPMTEPDAPGRIY